MRRALRAAAVALAAAGLGWALLRDDGRDLADDLRGARIVRLELDSRAVGRKMPVSVVVPAGARAGSPRPLLVVLHGRDGDERSHLVQELMDGLHALGRRAPVVAFPYGDEASFWHDREDGRWGSFVVDEVVPRVARRFGADPRRVALGGVSMGGLGAYDIVRLHPGRFCAVGGHAPALWRTSGETADGAFDDAEDFARHDVVGAARTAPAPFLELPVWLDAGDEDPFRPGDEAFVTALRAAGADVTVREGDGGHENSYWNSRWPQYLRFYARALHRCRR